MALAHCCMVDGVISVGLFLFASKRSLVVVGTIAKDTSTYLGAIATHYPRYLYCFFSYFIVEYRHHWHARRIWHLRPLSPLTCRFGRRDIGWPIGVERLPHPPQSSMGSTFPLGCQCLLGDRVFCRHLDRVASCPKVFALGKRTCTQKSVRPLN